MDAVFKFRLLLSNPIFYVLWAKVIEFAILKTRPKTVFGEFRLDIA